MKQYSSLQRIIEGSALLLSFIFQETIIHMLKASALIARQFSVFFISIVLIVIIFFIVEILLKFIMNSKWVRRMLFNGDFIEGEWVMVTYDLATNQEFAYSMISIIGRQEHILICGDIYDSKSFVHLGNFRSEMAHYNSPDLLYNYTYEIDDQINNKQGFAKIKFISRINEAPLMLNGFSIDFDSSRKVSFIAWKIEDKKLKKISMPEHFKDAFVAYVKSMKDKSKILQPATNN